MILKELRFLIIILSFFPLFCISQIDTSEALSYFPLQIGNKWQYYDVYTIDDYSTSHYRTVTVLGDTLMPNGKKYRVLENEYFYFRIDTSNLKVYAFNPDPYLNCENGEILIFDLVLPDSGIYNSCYYMVYISEDSGSVGDLLFSEDYLDYTWFEGVTRHYKLSKGFGISEWFEWELGGTEGRLTGALINGVMYGEIIVLSIDNTPTPSRYKLSQNYPNPFNPKTTIKFELDSPMHAELVIFNQQGKKIKTLLNSALQAGTHEFPWHGKNDKNEDVASGIYYYQLRTERQIESRKMLLLR